MQDQVSIIHEGGMSELERMNAGEWYDSRDTEILEMHHEARRLCRAFNRVETDQERAAILRELVGDGLGPGVYIREPFQCDFPGRLILGKGVVMNYGVTILNCGIVTIGEDAGLGPGVTLIAVRHPLDRKRRDNSSRRRGTQAAAICIGARAWIGASVVINPGIKVGEAAVVLANAAVTKDVPAGAVVGGVPARVLRWIPGYSESETHD